MIKNIGIKSLMTLALLLVLPLGEANASQMGKVVSSQAVVFSDPYLRSPIGTLSLGTELLLSDEKINNGKAYIISLKNTVAYIKSEDVVSSSTIKSDDTVNKKQMNSHFDHPVQDSLEKVREDDFTKNNFLLLEVGASNFIGGDWDKFNSVVLGRDSQPTTGVSLFIEHAPKIHLHSIAVGVSYLTQADPQSSLSAFSLIGDLNFRLVENQLFNIAVGFSGYVVAEMQLKMGAPLERFTGSAFGAGPKLTLSLFPLSKFSINISGRYQYYQTVGFENIALNNFQQEIGIDELSNFSISVGFRIQVL